MLMGPVGEPVGRAVVQMDGVHQTAFRKCVQRPLDGAHVQPWSQRCCLLAQLGERLVGWRIDEQREDYEACACPAFPRALQVLPSKEDAVV